MWIVSFALGCLGSNSLFTNFALVTNELLLELTISRWYESHFCWNCLFCAGTNKLFLDLSILRWYEYAFLGIVYSALVQKDQILELPISRWYKKIKSWNYQFYAGTNNSLCELTKHRIYYIFQFVLISHSLIAILVSVPSYISTIYTPYQFLSCRMVSLTNLPILFSFRYQKFYYVLKYLGLREIIWYRSIYIHVDRRGFCPYGTSLYIFISLFVIITSIHATYIMMNPYYSS